MIPDYKKFFQTSLKWKSIRVNTLKIGREKLLKKLENKFEIKEIPWYENGLWVKGEISKCIEYYMGYYHIQEAGSMIPPLFLQPEKRGIVIDACAAPGSKTTQISMMMENNGMVVANDINIKRIRALVHNIQKMGAMNVIVTNYDVRRLKEMGIKANYILLDAPCTASGKISKIDSILKKWKYSRIKAMSAKQKKLIEGAYHALEDNGIMVYSTCSLEPEENEEVIDFALKNFDFEIEKVHVKGLKTRKGIKRWFGKEYEGAEKCIRIWPQDNNTEGFFICRLRKS